MSLIARFLTAFTGEDKGADEAPGLVEDQAGAVYLIQADGTRVLVSGGGGSQPFAANWCIVSFPDAPATLTPGASSYTMQPADLTIVQQAGTDFSVGARPGHPTQGAILSAAGGWFQAAMFFPTPSGVTLDGGSTAQRWLELFMNIGDPTDPLPHIGIDAFVPVLPVQNLDLAATVLSAPGHTPPGGLAMWSMGIEFEEATGTDEITDPLASAGNLFIWQIA